MTKGVDRQDRLGVLMVLSHAAGQRWDVSTTQTSSFGRIVSQGTRQELAWENHKIRLISYKMLDQLFGQPAAEGMLIWNQLSREMCQSQGLRVIISSSITTTTTVLMMCLHYDFQSLVQRKCSIYRTNPILARLIPAEAAH